MFMDMSVMVEAQGDMLDDIETQVSTSVCNYGFSKKVVSLG